MTGGEKICTFIEHYVLIPEAAHVGQSMKPMKFQKQFILEVYDNLWAQDEHICRLRLKLASYFHAGFELEKTM